MEQTKAVWTVHKARYGLYRVQSDSHSFGILGQTDADNICARLNATEGLNVEALPELIEAAKKLEASDTKYTKNTITVTRDSFAALQSALTKLGE